MRQEYYLLPKNKAGIRELREVEKHPRFNGFQGGKPVFFDPQPDLFKWVGDPTSSETHPPIPKPE